MLSPGLVLGKRGVIGFPGGELPVEGMADAACQCVGRPSGGATAWLTCGVGPWLAGFACVGVVIGPEVDELLGGKAVQEGLFV